MADCKVSVCIPTYNYGTFLAETIESVLAQSYTDFELVIVDDNSGDDTREVVESYAARDPRIRFSVNSRNLGMVENWNHCLTLARGEYVKYVFGDDLLASTDALARMVAVLEANSSVSLVCSARNFIDESSQPLRVRANFQDGIFSGTGVINHCLKKQGNLIGEPSVVMFRKKHACRGFLPHYRQIVDLEMWFHLLEQGDFAFIEEPLCSFRVHQRQQTKKNKDNAGDIDDVFFLIEDYLDKDYIELSPLMKKYLKYDHIYGIWKMQRQGRIGRKEALERLSPYSLLTFRLWYPLYKGFKPCLKLYRKALQISPSGSCPR